MVKERMEFVIMDGKMIEVAMTETTNREYFALATCEEWQLCGTHIDKDPSKAFFGSVDKLIAFKQTRK
jgi:hypothetical protein